MSKFHFLIDFIQKNRWLLGKAVLLGFFSSILTVLIPVSIGKYYELVFDFNSYRSKIFDFLPFDAAKDVLSFLYFFLVLVILKTICLLGDKIYIGVIKERLAFDLRNRLFFAQLHLPLTTYEQKGIGKYLLRFSGDLVSIQSYLTKGLIRFSIDVVLVLIIFAVFYVMNWRIGLAISLVFVGAIFILILLNTRLSKATRKKRNAKSGLLSFVNTRLRTISSIKLLNRHQPENLKFLKKSNFLHIYGISYQKITAGIRTIIPTVMYLMLAVVLFTVYYLKENAIETDAGSLLVMVLLLVTLLPVFNRLLRVNIVWELGSISFEKLLSIINEGDAMRNSKPTPFVFQRGILSIENLSYHYQNKPPLFKNLNLSIKNNNITLISGKAGSGKTTLLKLMCGMYKPQVGSVLIDGQCSDQVNAKSLMKKIAVVSDEIPLLGKTVFEAISYSRNKLKKPKAGKILNELQKHHKQQLLLDDRIGDLACRLSKGEKKLLIIARALLTNKPILLLDEPFEAIDELTKLQLCKQLNQLSKKRTIVIFSKLIHCRQLNVQYSIQLNQMDAFNTIPNKSLLSNKLIRLAL